MVHRRWWILLALVATGCYGLKACDEPRPVESLPVKLWSCTAKGRRCEVYARFKTVIDCDLFRDFLDAECAPKAPDGEIHCKRTNHEAYLREWYSECSERDITFDMVRDGGTWAR
jgi:hypothetical protein